jgi:hypothetical protein
MWKIRGTIAAPGYLAAPGTPRAMCRPRSSTSALGTGVFVTAKVERRGRLTWERTELYRPGTDGGR